MNRILCAITTAVAVVLQLGTLRAQDEAVGLLTAGKQDANLLLKSYMSPFGEAFSGALGQNWYNTANCLKLLRPNVQAGLTLLRIPESSHYFNPSTLGLKNLRPLGGNPNSVPTIAGASSAISPQWVVLGNVSDSSQPGGVREVALDTLPDLLRGLDLQQVFVPYVQANLGIGGSTEINLRYAPTLDLSSLGGGIIPGDLLQGSIKFWGIGIKHEVLQWIPVAKRLPFSFSVYANHSRMTYSLNASVAGPQSGDYPRSMGGGLTLENYQVNGSTDFSNQKFVMEGRSTTYGLVVSKKILMLTGYAGLGMQHSTFTLAAEGNYPIRSGLVQNNFNPTRFTEQWTSLERPLDLSLEDGGRLRLGIGARVKLGILAVHAEAFKLGAFNGYCGGLTVGF